jgi:hypothetical protein
LPSSVAIVVVVVGLHDEPVDDERAHAPEISAKDAPRCAAYRRGRRPRAPAFARDEAEVLEPRLVVVLSAGGAGEEREAAPDLAQFLFCLLAREPEARGLPGFERVTTAPPTPRMKL